MKIQILSKSPKETQEIASLFIRAVLGLGQKKLKLKRALIISLEGNLGSGKTEFLKGVAKGVELKEKIFSPTFLLMKRFPLKRGPFKFLWHLDCYRVQKASEMKALGFEEMARDSQNIIFIEWGNQIERLLPKSHWIIKFEIKGGDDRKLEFIL